MNNISDFYCHNNCNIDDEYKKLRIHIALERADINKDWDSFNKIYKCSPEFLNSHLNMTKMIFDYNFLNLSKDLQKKLFE
jgi:hypothetical protein